MTSTFLLVVADNLSRGISIAVAGMLIVAIALTFISLFIAALPRILAKLEDYLPTVDEHAKSSHPESSVPEDDAVLAAIGFVLHTEFQKQLTQTPEKK